MNKTTYYTIGGLVALAAAYGVKKHMSKGRTQNNITYSGEDDLLGWGESFPAQQFSEQAYEADRNRSSWSSGKSGVAKFGEFGDDFVGLDYQELLEKWESDAAIPDFLGYQINPRTVPFSSKFNR